MAGQVIGIASRILTRSGGFEGLGFVVTFFLVQQVADNSPAARLGNDDLR
jgi:S1-C subfamily serine protease